MRTASTLSELEELERLAHSTGLRGDALRAHWAEVSRTVDVPTKRLCAHAETAAWSQRFVGGYVSNPKAYWKRIIADHKKAGR